MKKKYDARNLSPFFRKHQTLARLLAVLIIITFPIAMTIMLWYEYWNDVTKEFNELTQIAFRKWRV